MEGLHHFKFMYQRFLTSTLGWKEEEQGAYMRLLIVQFDQGGIPADLDAIGAISPVARKIWSKKLKGKFKHVNPDGTLFNKVMAGVREDAIKAYESSVVNGQKGGRPKKPNGKPPGSENNNPKETGRFSTGNREGNPNERQPETSNHIDTLKEGKSVNTPADLLKSNLFKQPNIPTLELVKAVFRREGGTDEMAQKFFDNNEATGWFFKGSAITNFTNLVPGFITNWKHNEVKNKISQVSTSVADAITAARAKNNP